MSKTTYHRILILTFGLFFFSNTSHAQKFSLFSKEVKKDYPSAVYNFLETYLYKIDSLERANENIDRILRDDKVIFLEGSASLARNITPETLCKIKTIENKYYEVSWLDNTNETILSLAFPMQYELLLGRPKVELEKELKFVLSVCQDYIPKNVSNIDLFNQENGGIMTTSSSNYYLENLNTTSYYIMSETGDTIPIFSDKDNWMSAVNLFQGCIDDISEYKLYIEQNMYGFKSIQYTITLQQWLAYCQKMMLTTYFAIEEEREDGFKALLIAESHELGFNHMLSLIIPSNFVSNKRSVFKATMNAYIPTHNVKDLYQVYVKKTKKQI